MELINRLGGIVGYREPGGPWRLSSWDGDTLYAMVRLGVGGTPPIFLMRHSVVEALPMEREDPVPVGWFGVIAFDNDPPIRTWRADVMERLGNPNWHGERQFVKMDRLRQLWRGGATVEQAVEALRHLGD